MKKDACMDHTRRYAIARHHAWAGSVLLAILLALRVFMESSTYHIPENIFIGIGILLVCYIIIALLFTYKHRSGLVQQKQNKPVATSTSNNESIVSKDQQKIQKKQVKAEIKKQKKQQKQ